MDGETLEAVDLGGGSDVAIEETQDVGTDISTESSQDIGTSADESTGRTEGTEQKPDAQGDGRQVAAQVRNHLAELKRTNPTLEKQLREAYFRGEAARALGPIPELKSKLEALELYGGPEGIQALQEAAQANEALDQGFERGDPKILDGWVADFPEGFKKLIVPAFDKLEQMDAKAYERAGSSVATKFLAKYGVFDGMEQLGAAIHGDKKEDAMRLFNDLVGKVFSPMRTLAGQAQADPYADRAKELDEREQGIQQKAAEAFRGEVVKSVNSDVQVAVNKQLSTLLGNRKLTSEQGNRVRKSINEEVSRLVNRDPNYDKQVKALLAAGDRDRAAKFIVSRANAQIATATKTILRDFNLLGNGTPQRTPVKVAPTGVQTIAGRPSVLDVDFSRTDKSRFVASIEHGEAWLKNGKKAAW